MTDLPFNELATSLNRNVRLTYDCLQTFRVQTRRAEQAPWFDCEIVPNSVYARQLAERLFVQTVDSNQRRQT